MAREIAEFAYYLHSGLSERYMSIPSFALESILRVLDEVGFVKLVEKGRNIERVIPNIPA